MTVRQPSYAHLRRLTDAGGLYEHALGTTPRREHGYCVDDVARALVVLSREPAGDQDDLLAGYLQFVLDAQAPDGRFRNRRSADLSWQGEPTLDDCWGRALWGLGTVVAARPALRAVALAAFDRGAGLRSPHSRARAFAALGAAEVLTVYPNARTARTLLARTAYGISTSTTGAWPWPEPRLTYADAVLPEVLLAGGDALGDPLLLQHGLRLLGWLLDRSSRSGHLSVTPVGGCGPLEVSVGDQQPIEVAALADACARAAALTGDPRWAAGLALAVGWFLGDNDAGVAMLDESSGGGCDGLEAHGRNENQGAESTLALLSTLQHGRGAALLPT